MSTTTATQAGRWYAACLYAGCRGWGVVRDVARPGTTFGGSGHYQMQAGPGRYITQEAAQAAAEALNQPPPEKPDAQPAGTYGWDDDDDNDDNDDGRDYEQELQGDFYSQAFD